MLILRNESEIHRITNPAIRQLMALRFLQLNATDDPDAPDAGHVEFIVVEAGDPVPEIEQAAGFPILTSLFDDLPFEHPLQNISSHIQTLPPRFSTSRALPPV